MEAARREFRFVEGTSSKFWAIILKETSLTVHYGKLNTTGTAQEKSFPSAEAAKKEYDKLILEKTKKGYTEVANAANVFVPHATVKAPPTPKAEPEPEPAAAIQVAKSSGAPIATESAVAPTQIVRKVHLNLTPEQWSILSWHPPVYLKRPEPRPFDQEVNFRWCAAYAANSGHYWGPNLPAQLTKEESWLWIQILTINEPKAFQEHVKSYEETGDEKIREFIQEKIGHLCFHRSFTLPRTVSEEDRTSTGTSSTALPIFFSGGSLKNTSPNANRHSWWTYEFPIPCSALVSVQRLSLYQCGRAARDEEILTIGLRF